VIEIKFDSDPAAIGWRLPFGNMWLSAVMADSSSTKGYFYVTVRLEAFSESGLFYQC